MTSNITQIQEGLSDKIGLMIQFASAFVAGFVIGIITLTLGFTKGWQLALVLCAVFPLLSGAAFLMSKLVAGGTDEESSAYADAGSVAQQVISSMRTVVAFGGEEREIKRYAKHLDIAEKAGLWKALASGVGVGFIQGLIFLVYALAFWYGNRLIPGTMSGGDVLNVFFAIIIGAFSLGNATPYIASIGTACGAAFEVFGTIDRVSAIDTSSDLGEKPAMVKGEIAFKHVKFHYPARTDVPILHDFSLTIGAGKTVALVGMSGSGKSTAVKLVERFYDAVSGSVELDGRDLKTLNVSWLRQQIGIVSQEPTLFNCSLRQNIKYGLKDDGSSLSEDVINTMIEDACKQANAWEFIQKLPFGLDTNVGESGSMLSGGQRQR